MAGNPNHGAHGHFASGSGGTNGAGSEHPNHPLSKQMQKEIAKFGRQLSETERSNVAHQARSESASRAAKTRTKNAKDRYESDKASVSRTIHGK